MEIQTINPLNSQILSTYQVHTDQQVQMTITQSKQAYLQYRQMCSSADRSVFLRQIAKGLREQKDLLARQMALEIGKPIMDGRAEVEKSAQGLEFFADNAMTLFKDQILQSTQYTEAVTHPEPIGPILGVMPWNYPLWQVVRFLAPNLMLGNSFIIKPAEMVLGTNAIFQNIIAKVTPVANLVQTSLVLHSQMHHFYESTDIRGVTFTGSERVGKIIGAQAAGHLKKVVLELGGSDAYIVLPDADVELAAQVCAQARMVNNGQSCIAGKRFIVHKKVRELFLEKMVLELKKWQQGDPLLKTTQVGPMAAERFWNCLFEQTQELQAAGWDLYWSSGSQKPFFPIQIYTWFHSVKLKLEDVFYTEELFGPVALIVEYENKADAVLYANQSPYGLGAGIFSRNIEQAKELAKQLECGMVAINTNVRSEPAVSFGGMKNSGFGRELGSAGALEFANLKSILVN